MAKALKIILAFCILFNVSSCSHYAREEDKSKCRLIETGVVSEVFVIEGEYVPGDDIDDPGIYSEDKHYFVVNGDTVRQLHQGMDRIVAKGDSVRIFQDWDGYRFYYEMSGTEEDAINAYVKPKMFCFWKDVLGRIALPLCILLGIFVCFACFPLLEALLGWLPEVFFIIVSWTIIIFVITGILFFEIVILEDFLISLCYI